jgi:hypothetical protein
MFPLCLLPFPPYEKSKTEDSGSLCYLPTAELGKQANSPPIPVGSLCIILDSVAKEIQGLHPGHEKSIASEKKTCLMNSIWQKSRDFPNIEVMNSSSVLLVQVGPCTHEGMPHSSLFPSLFAGRWLRTPGIVFLTYLHV